LCINKNRRITLKRNFNKRQFRCAVALIFLFFSATANAAIFAVYQAPVGVTTTGVTNLPVAITSTSGSTYDAAFEYGPTVAYGTTTPTQVGVIPPNFIGLVSSGAIAGLTCGTTYHYRLDILAAANYPDATFTTSACAAAVPAPVPTLSEWAVIALSMLIVGFGMWQMRRRND
jgi:hypothetical protein